MEVWYSITEKIHTDWGTLFVRMTFDREYLKPLGMHFEMGKGGTCFNVSLHVLSNVCNLAMKHGANILEIRNRLKDHSCMNPSLLGVLVKYRSCFDAIAGWIDSVWERYDDGRIAELIEGQQEVDE